VGGFYGSIHVKADSIQQIKVVLEMAVKKKGYKFYLAPPINGWVSIFPNDSGQDERVSSYIAKHLDYDFLHLMVHDDDIFCYWYYRKGKLIDEYNSRSDYFGGFVSRKKREKSKGNPEVFKNLVGDQNKMNQIVEILNKSNTINKSASINPNIPEKVKKFEEISKEINKLINDPHAITKFISENPHLLNEKTNPFVKEVKKLGLTSPEAIQKLAAKSEHIQYITEKIIFGLLQSQGYLNEKGNWKEGLFETPLKPNNDTINEQEDIIEKADPYQPPPGLFASDTMSKFADTLGIPNAVTSYEYLASGETDGILEWDEFTEIS
jgi:hypothetical protein